MSTTTPHSGDGSEAQHADDAPTTLIGIASDRCSRCGSQLAVDQRYCVECGTRRGKPRFGLTGAGDSSSPDSGSSKPTGFSGQVRQLSSSATLLLGILVILLAIGVGVLIGHTKNAAPAGSKVNVYASGSSGSGGSTSSGTGSGSGSSATVSTTASGSSSAGSTSSTKAAASGSKTSATSKSSTKATKTTAAAATKPKVAVAPTQNKAAVIGGSCTAGTAGCQNGKETGNFF